MGDPAIGPVMDSCLNFCRRVALQVVHKELHCPVHYLLPGRIDICAHSSPIVPGILDDQDFDWRSDRLRFFWHVAGVLYRYGGVLVSLDHQQRRTRWSQVVDRAQVRKVWRYRARA